MVKVNTNNLESNTLKKKETFFKRKKLSESAGGEKIGCSLYEIPEGHKSWPYHYHTNNEEAIFVLDGKGIARIDGENIPIKKGDYIALLEGKRGAHRVINNSDEKLKYLMISTMNEPEVLVYPDSEKLGVFVGSPPGGKKERSIEKFYKLEDTVEYWERE